MENIFKVKEVENGGREGGIMGNRVFNLLGFTGFKSG